MIPLNEVITLSPVPLVATATILGGITSVDVGVTVGVLVGVSVTGGVGVTVGVLVGETGIMSVLAHTEYQ